VSSRESESECGYSYPQGLLYDIQVGRWLEYATYIVGGGPLEPACRTLNEALSMRTYLAGYTLTVADMAIWGQLQGDNFCRLMS